MTEIADLNELIDKLSEAREDSLYVPNRDQLQIFRLDSGYVVQFREGHSTFTEHYEKTRLGFPDAVSTAYEILRWLDVYTSPNGLICGKEVSKLGGKPPELDK